MNVRNSILKFIGLLITVTLLFAMLPSTEAIATTGTVYTVCSGGGCDFTSIQAAIDAASPGDTINVASGTYAENYSSSLALKIDKSISLIGTGLPIVDGQNKEKVVQITANDVLIAGMKFMNADAGLGIYLYEVSNTILSGCESSNNNIGLLMAGVNEATIDGNAFIDNSYRSIVIQQDSDNNVVKGNTITMTGPDTLDGIVIGSDSGGNIIGAAGEPNLLTIPLTTSQSSGASHLPRAFYLAGVGASDNIIQYNTIDGSASAIQIDGNSGTTTVDHNTIGQTTPPSFRGVQINGGSLILTKNVIKDSVRPVEFWDAADVTIIGNTIDGTTFDAINIGSVGTVTGIHQNAFVNIAGPVKIANRTAFSVDASQNYWGKVTPPSEGVDFIGDVKYSPWLGATPGTSPMTYYVDTTGTIQEAIDAAEDGSTIFIEAGSFTENLVVDKPLTIIGDGKTSTVLTAPTSPVITVTVNDVSIKDIGINDPVRLDEGIRVEGATSNLTLQDISFTNLAPTSGNAEAVNFIGSFDSFTADGLEVSGPAAGDYTRGIGIFLSKPNIASNFSISNSTFENVFVGIYINGYLDGVSIQDNTFGPMDINDCQAAAAGIYFGDGPDLYTINNLTVSGNEFTDYCRGLYVWDYADDGLITNVTVDNNTFTNSIYSSGIRFIADWWTDVSHATMLEGPLNLTNNTFIQDEKIVNGDGVSMIDIRLTGASPTSQINLTGNDITFSGSFDVSNYGMLFRGPVTNLSITDNVLNGGNVGGASVDLPPTTGLLIGSNHNYFGEISSDADVAISLNSITGFENGVGIYDFDSATFGGLPDGAVVSLEENRITSNGIGINYGSGEEVDASPNWWGSIAGPSASQIEGNVDYSPWCGDPECTFLVDAVAGADLQASIDALGGSGTLYVPAGTYTQTGAYTLGGVTLNLADGVIIQNTSPCFNITGDHTKITTESIGGAKCIATNSASGIVVNAGLTDIVIEGLEITGDASAGQSGIEFLGGVDYLQVVDNYIHDLTGAGLSFTGVVTHNQGIQGNLFMDLGLDGIIYPNISGLDATFNSWGVNAAPVITNVTTDPFTYVGLTVSSSGALSADQVATKQYSDLYGFSRPD